MSLFKRGFAAVLIAVAACLPAGRVLANHTTNFQDDTDVTLDGSGITLVILAGSSADSVSVGSTTITLSVLAGEALTLRYPGPNPGRLPNDGGLSQCHWVNGNNDVTVSGPKTVTFTPNTTPCNRPSGNGGGGTLDMRVKLLFPNGGEQLTAGQTFRIHWTIEQGDEPHTITLELSTDGGLDYHTVIAADEPPDGEYFWTVPNVSTTQARVRVKAVVPGGTVRSFDASDADFTIQGTAPPPPPPPGQGPPAPPVPSGENDPLLAGWTISDEKGLPLASGPTNCVAETLIKLPDDGNLATQHDSTVYYCGRDGKRYVFPNAKVYFSWYKSFGAVVIIGESQMASIPLGGNATYRPGIRLVKIESDPRTYAVAMGGYLRWIPTEARAIELYGPDWAKRVDDVPVTFWVDYKFGAPM